MFRDSINIAATLVLTVVALAEVSGCGDPCLPTFNADTVIVAANDICFITTDKASGSTGGTTADITSGTGDTSSTTADPVSPLDPKPDALPVCIAIPGAGEVGRHGESSSRSAPTADAAWLLASRRASSRTRYDH